MARQPLMRPVRAAIVALFCSLLGPVGHAAAGNVDLPRFPSISPDGQTIVFSWRGDLWKVDATGGHATRLTSHPANDLQSAWSADGERIAFSTDRTGYTNIFMMNTDGTDIRQVTDIDRPCSPVAFGVDDDGGEIVTFHSTLENDIYRSYRPYYVSSAGGDLVRVHNAFGSHPVLSSDGGRVLFSRGGYYDGWERRHYRGAESIDVWIHDRDDDSFTRLTTFDGNDGMARWGADDSVLFLSDRKFDCVNLYRMDAERGEKSAKRLTNFKKNDIQALDVTPDGVTAVLAVWDDIYTLDLTERNAKPKKLDITANEDERDNYQMMDIGRNVSDAALSPDGKVMAYVAYGEVYVRNIEDGNPTRRVTSNHAREKDIAWSADGLKLYFVSDLGGTEAIYVATVDTTRGDVKEAFEEATNPKEEEPEAEAVEEEEKEEAEEKPAEAARADDPISGTWSGTADVPDMGPVPYSFTLKLAEDNTVTGSLDAGVYSGPLTGDFDPDAMTLQFSVTTGLEGLVIDFDLRLEDGTLTGEASADEAVVQISATRDAAGAADEPEDEPKENGDKKKEKKKGEKEEKKEVPKEFDPERWHDAMTFNVEPFLQREFSIREPDPSPDGKWLAYRGTRGDIYLLDLETGDTRDFLKGWDASTSLVWSPDGKYIAYNRSDLNFNADIFIVPADGSAEAVNITRHPGNDFNPRFSADGKILAFVSERVNKSNDVWVVFLDKELEALTDQELKDYFEEAGKAAKKREPVKVEVPEEEDEEGQGDAAPAEEEETEEEEAVEEEADELELDDAYLRIRRVTRLDGSESGIMLLPAGDTILFNARGDVSGLHSIKWNGRDQKRIGSNVRLRQLSLTGDKIVVLTGGQAGTMKAEGGSVKTIGISDRIRIDLEKQSSQKFIEAARRLGEEYYHPTMNDLDWPAVTKKYHALAKKARTAEEFNWVANHFLGELNGSHMGIRARGESTPNRQSYGRLGTIHRRVEGGFEVTAILPESPADKGPMALQVGDVITAIEFEPFGETDTIEAALKDRIGEETVVTISRTMDDDEVKELNVLITPTSSYGERSLKYEAWRLNNNRLVEEWSDNRLGYIHIQGMNQPSLDVFERDLFAAAEGKDGLIIDVRNNGGGWTADRLLSSIMVQSHAYTVPRGADWSITGHYPQDRLFIQRYTLPINMLCNEKSYSNAEIISHAFKVLKRGTLVGQQTHGSVISTGGFGLIDGTSVRLPFRGWFVDDGKGPNGLGTNMELNGAMPDLLVVQTPEAESANDDEQLRAAVEDLLERLD